MIKLEKASLDRAAAEGIITEAQSSQLWSYLTSQGSTASDLNLIHFFYYFGGVICILAMTLFMNLGWEQFGGAGLTLISLCYLISFSLAGNHLWKNKNYQIPGGILLTIAVCMTPLLVYGFQRWTGFWGDDGPSLYGDYHVWIRSSWVLMSFSTIIVGGLFLRNFAFSFLTMPIAVAMFYLTMDLVPLIHPNQTYYWDYYNKYAVGLGALMIVFAYLLDRTEKEVDYSFWIYLFGVLSFWGGLTSMNSDSEIGKFLYFVINLGLLFLGLFLYRKVFILFGALGALVYFYHLARQVFEDSMWFPFVTTLMGLAVMYVGIKYQKNKEKVDRKFTQLLPQALKKLRPAEKS